MKYFITGATGFVGRRLMEKLVQKYGGKENEFICLVRGGKSEYLQNLDKRIRVVKGDITDIESMRPHLKEVDFVFHLAGLVEYGHFKKENYYKINVEGSRNVFKLSKKFAVKKVIYLSSAAILHPMKNHVTEDDLALEFDRHVTHYTKSKYFSYKLAKEFRREGLNIVTVLPASVFGYNSPLFNPLIKNCLKYKLVILPKKGVSMSMILLDDLVRGIILCQSPDVKNQDFIFSDKDITLEGLVKAIEESIKKRIMIIKMPNTLLHIIFLFAEPFRRFFRINTLFNYETFKFVSSNFLAKSRTVHKLNFKPSDFQEEFVKTLKKYQNA